MIGQVAVATIVIYEIVVELIEIYWVRRSFLTYLTYENLFDWLRCLVEVTALQRLWSWEGSVSDRGLIGFMCMAPGLTSSTGFAHFRHSDRRCSLCCVRSGAQWRLL